MLASSQATIENNSISGNSHGILMMLSSQATITGNVIRDNERYGVVLYERPCFDWTEDVFTGYVTGRENTGGGNAEGDYCPEALAFLFTEEGGELDRTHDRSDLDPNEDEKEVSLLLYGEAITRDLLLSAYESLVTYYRHLYSMFGVDFYLMLEGSVGMFLQQQVMAEAAEGLIRQTILARKAMVLRITVPEARVSEEAEQRYRNVLALFEGDEFLLAEHLRAQGLSIEEYQQALRLEVKRELQQEILWRVVVGPLEPDEDGSSRWDDWYTHRRATAQVVVHDPVLRAFIEYHRENPTAAIEILEESRKEVAAVDPYIDYYIGRMWEAVSAELMRRRTALEALDEPTEVDQSELQSLAAMIENCRERSLEAYMCFIDTGDADQAVYERVERMKRQ